MMWHDGWGAGNWFVMTTMMLLICVLVVAAIIWFVTGARHLPSPNGGRPQQLPDAGQLLDARLARGEISQAEYQQRRDLLGG
jgi:uncharacterized membrane protein